MTKKAKVIGWVEVALGVFFLVNAASDIQLGFGLVLIALGANQLSK